MAPTVHLPTFLPAYQERFDKGEDKTALNRQLLLRDWITPGLRAEIVSLYPAAGEKEADTGRRDQDVFIVKAKSLFPEGCFFASFKQLDQAAKLFLDAWAISKVHGQSKIYCARGISRGKSTKLCSDVCLQQKRSPSEKEKFKCPFEIRYRQGQKGHPDIHTNYTFES
jgi:hypothetical protein